MPHLQANVEDGQCMYNQAGMVRALNTPMTLIFKVDLDIIQVDLDPNLMTLGPLVLPLDH